MTELPGDIEAGDDGFLRMDQFSDAEIGSEDGDAELGDEPWYTDPEPLGDAAWSRVLAGAVSDTEARPDLDDLVAPAAADPASDDPATGDTAAAEPGSGGDGAAHHGEWGGGGPEDGPDVDAQVIEGHEPGTPEG